MRKMFHRKTVLLAAAALALIVTLTAGSAMAYFTAYSTANGAVKLDIGFTETEPHDKVDEKGKHVTIENIGDYDCFVRVKVFADIEVNYDAGKGWEDGGDGYWYYKPVLAPKKETTKLLVTYSYPADPEKTKEFNIIVVQECTPVIFDKDGNPAPDWTTVIGGNTDNADNTGNPEGDTP